MTLAGLDTSSSTSAEPRLLRVPGWERFPWLRAGFSARQGGLSSAYGPGEQNLGWTAEDDPGVVAKNRSALVRAVSKDAELALVTVRQVHSGVVRDLEADAGPWMTADGKARLEGDGLISCTGGRLLAILTADCVPVLVADTRLRAAGAFHAGWRGTLARIVEHGVQLMGQRYGSKPDDLIAAIGPCIGACCFEVGAEVREAFTTEFADVDDLFRPESVAEAQTAARFRMDVAEANRRQLIAAGVSEQAIWVAGECTSCSRLGDGRRAYFSHRSERGFTGRMLSAIGVVAPVGSAWIGSQEV